MSFVRMRRPTFAVALALSAACSAMACETAMLDLGGKHDAGGAEGGDAAANAGAPTSGHGGDDSNVAGDAGENFGGGSGAGGSDSAAGAGDMTGGDAGAGGGGAGGEAPTSSGVVAGGDSTCYRMADGRTKCWGYRGDGKLPLPDA